MPNEMDIAVSSLFMGIEQDSSTNLTVNQCEEVAAALFQDTDILQSGPEKDELLQLAKGCHDLAALKRLMARKVN
jgi:hypothetical protein